jgi:hypothetical protein
MKWIKEVYGAFTYLAEVKDTHIAEDVNTKRIKVMIGDRNNG